MDPDVERPIRDWMPSSQHIRLCLLVSLDVQKLHSVASTICETFALPRIDVSSKLPDALLDVRLTRRTTQAGRWLEDACRIVEGSPVLVSGIDLLFHPALGVDPNDRLDPLVLLLRISRHKPLLVLWPGSYNGAALTYAVPQHAHYRSWSNPEAKIISLPIS